MTGRKSRLQQELSIIPTGWSIAAGVSVVVVEILFSVFLPHWAHGDMPQRPWIDLIGAVGALFLAATILLTGYIYADAKRRGMNAILWTVLVLLVPKPIGFIAYFLLRAPLQVPCPQCGTAVGSDFRYCTKCGYTLAPMCAHCGKPIRRDYAVCPYCGKNAVTVTQTPAPQT